MVVRNQWRTIRLEATKQALGGANRRKCQPGQARQSACSAPGFCGNLINALKLLANQQEDGDGLIQNILTNLGERSRKGVTNGLREFIKIDNQRALEVGYLSKGMGKFRVRRPKISEGCPEVTVRESPDELTEEEEMKQQQRMAIIQDLTRKIRSKGRMDAKNRWWVAELLAADCEKAWIHA